jgi:Ni,Fe-hydrogenase III large subunit
MTAMERTTVDAAGWAGAAARLADGSATLLGLWADGGAVRMALLDEARHAVSVVRLDCPEGRFPSVGRVHAPAIRLERAVRDLSGLVPEDAPDARPWLDHGRWADGARRAGGDGVPYAFLPVEGEGLHRIPVGPVHAGIIEPGHFRFTANGEAVVRLEARLGYVHRGLEALMAGADLDRAARLAARASGDSTAAFGWAFAMAVEEAAGLEPPARALSLRALMLELERLANHLGDVGAICNDAAFALMHAHTGILRERVLRASALAFGHRLMMDRIVPGGVAADLDADGAAAIRAVAAEIAWRLPALVELYDKTASLQDRTVGTGFLAPALARRFGAGGFVGRASGRSFDARRDLAPAPYAALRFEVPVFAEGDVDARLRLRVAEIVQSLSLVGQLLDALPGGPVRVDIDTATGEGLGLVEGFRGDVLAWVRLEAGTVGRCHLRDPSWFQWPLLEAAIEGNIVADFPLCNKSFNCSYAGHDL